MPPRPAPPGIPATILLSQIATSMPFLFEGFLPTPEEPHLAALLQLYRGEPMGSPDVVEVFSLCLGAHHATVAGFVPTDVDVHIREKLWRFARPPERVAMAELVLASRSWDYSRVSARWVRAPGSGARVSGHEGEWFSTAAAAYSSLRDLHTEVAGRVAEAIVQEVAREDRLLAELGTGDHIFELLRAATAVSHNLGDLDRVLEAWNLPDTDALRLRVHQMGHDRGRTLAPRLWAAGCLNTELMAAENHRHFALRRPRCLRRHGDLLLGFGPFLDDWGMRVARHPGLSPEEVGEVAEALIDGFSRLPGTVGYARALAGIEDAFPGGLTALCRHLPRRQAQQLRTGPLRRLCSIPRVSFEGRWRATAGRRAKELGLITRSGPSPDTSRSE